MAFLNLNADKLATLLATGTHKGELKRFFSESRNLLLLKQARVQNLPYGRIERIRTICERLPRSTDEVVRDWFQKNVTMADPLTVEQVISELSLYEEMDEPLPEKDGMQLARSALVHLFASEPDSQLVLFLQSSPGYAGDVRDVGGEDVAGDANPADEGTQPAQEAATIKGSRALSELIAAVMGGEDSAIDEALGPFSENIKIMVDALVATRKGDVEEAAGLMRSLDPQADEYKLIRGALERARHLPSDPQRSQQGLELLIPRRLVGYPRMDQVDVIGLCTNETENVVFVRPLGIVRDGEVFLLTPEDRLGLFPDSGDVMSFRMPGRRLPQKGDMVRWLVAEREDSAGKTRFHYTDEPGPVVEVINVPFSSAAPDQVRNFIKSQMTGEKSPASFYPLFALSDGVTISVPKSSDPRRDDAYEQPWQSWGSVQAWLVEGRQYVLGIPSRPASQLDLSPLEAAFKKLIRNLAEAHKSSITKNQIRDLAALIRTQSAGEVRQRAARVAESLEQIALDNDSLDELLPIIMSREEVQERVDGAVAERTEKLMKERSRLAVEVNSLRERSEGLQRESVELERQIKEQRRDTVDSVRQVFSRTIEEGVASLAQAEVFRAFLPFGGRSPTSDPVEESARLQIMLEGGPLTRDEAVSRLVAIGLKRRRAVALAILATLLGKAGAYLVIRGDEARPAGRVLGRIDAKRSGVVEIPMGLTSAAPMRLAISSAPKDLGALVVLDADLSPFEVYGSALLDRAFDTIMDGPAEGTRILLACSGGDIALPLPASIHRIAIVIDLNAPDHEGVLLEEIEEDDIPLLGALFRPLVDEVCLLRGAERQLVESMLATALRSVH